MANIYFNAHQKKKIDALSSIEGIDIPAFSEIEMQGTTHYECSTETAKTLYQQLIDLEKDKDKYKKLSSKQILAIEKAKRAIMQATSDMMRLPNERTQQHEKPKTSKWNKVFFGFLVVIGLIGALSGGIDDALSILTYIPHLSGYFLLGATAVFALIQTFFYLGFDLRYIGKQFGVSIFDVKRLTKLHQEQQELFHFLVSQFSLDNLESLKSSLTADGISEADIEDRVEKYRDLVQLIAEDMKLRQAKLAETSNKSWPRIIAEYVVTGIGGIMWGLSGFFLGKSAAVGTMSVLTSSSVGVVIAPHVALIVVITVGVVVACAFIAGYIAMERRGATRMLSGEQGKCKKLSEKLEKDDNEFQKTEVNVKKFKQELANNRELIQRRQQQENHNNIPPNQDSTPPSSINSVNEENAVLKKKLAESEELIRQLQQENRLLKEPKKIEPMEISQPPKKTGFNIDISPSREKDISGDEDTSGKWIKNKEKEKKQGQNNYSPEQGLLGHKENEDEETLPKESPIQNKSLDSLYPKLSDSRSVLDP